MLSSFVKNKNDSESFCSVRNGEKTESTVSTRKTLSKEILIEDRLEVTDFKFHSEIEKEGLGECKMFLTKTA